MTAYPILILIRSLIKFQSVVQEIQMKRAKRDILTYLLTYLLTYILTDQPSHRISISWLKIVLWKNYSFWGDWCLAAADDHGVGHLEAGDPALVTVKLVPLLHPALGKPQKKVLYFSGASTKAFSPPDTNLKEKVLFSLVDNPLPPPLPLLVDCHYNKKGFFVASLIQIDFFVVFKWVVFIIAIFYICHFLEQEHNGIKHLNNHRD